MILNFLLTFLYILQVSDVTTAINELFTALFYGSGSWLGLLLFIMFILGITLKFPKAGLLMLPVAVFLGVTYLENDLGWQAIIMWLASVFILLDIAYTLHKRG